MELIRHDEAAPYICRGLLIRIFRCTEETREATLQKLQHMARTAYGAAPAFTVQLIVVSGILQWTYEAQVYVGEHEKGLRQSRITLCDANFAADRGSRSFLSGIRLPGAPSLSIL